MKTTSGLDIPCVTKFYDPDKPTLRDRFAMAALQNLAYIKPNEEIAKKAYEIADAMLKAREGK